MNEIFRAIKYLQYRSSAGNAHGLHSPFVYDLYTNVITDQTPFYSFEIIEAIRAQMLLSKETIEVQDYGAGGASNHQGNRSVSAIAHRSVKPKKYGQLLFRLVNHFQPSTILEIGTSLGITTLYLASPNKNSRVITLEGSDNIAAIARENFKKAGATNIELIAGEFDEALERALKQSPSLDFVYFDGNHQKEPTLKYFKQCLAYGNESSVFVFDDIYWSKEMAYAWKEIKHDEAVKATIDLYSMGLVFFKKGMEKQDFKLRF